MKPVSRMISIITLPATVLCLASCGGGGGTAGGGSTIGTANARVLILQDDLTNGSTTLPKGTKIDISRIRNLNVVEPDDDCRLTHAHATSGGILIDGAGPFTDPEPRACGYGPVTNPNDPIVEKPNP